MTPVQPIDVRDLFKPVQEHLLDLLSRLSPDEWNTPTVCAGWSVKDVALHLLDGDAGVLSSKRDRDRSGRLPHGPSLIANLNKKNADWVESSRQMSPTVIMDLIGHLGRQVVSYWQTVDQLALNGVVSWAGPDRAPQWLDTARHYTERWHHQQHIRDAVERPGLKEGRFLLPVLDTFVRALPLTFGPVAAPDGASLNVHVGGEGGGDWTLVKERGQWLLYSGASGRASARVELDSDIAWRLFTKGIPKEEALQRSSLMGDPSLTANFFQTVSIIA